MSQIVPPRMRMNLSAKRRARFRSCIVTMAATPRSAAISLIMSRTSSWFLRSRLLVGSFRRSTEVSCAMALPITIFCASPPPPAESVDS